MMKNALFNCKIYSDPFKPIGCSVASQRSRPVWVSIHIIYSAKQDGSEWCQEKSFSTHHYTQLSWNRGLMNQRHQWFQSVLIRRFQLEWVYKE